MIVGIVTMVAGLTVFLAARPFARRTIRLQNRAWGFRLGDTSEQMALWVNRVVGALAVVIGIGNAIASAM
ncbi:MAG TPA: hypothetical protein VHJ34_11140 [Actinomycetota bacterium]|nr:hypothetical protein [Actinomycetota bacterium]